MGVGWVVGGGWSKGILGFCFGPKLWFWPRPKLNNTEIVHFPHVEKFMVGDFRVLLWAKAFGFGPGSSEQLGNGAVPILGRHCKLRNTLPTYNLDIVPNFSA